MSQYANGAELERKIKRALEAKGHYVIRSAGSKGLFDLIMIDQEKRSIRLIQVKKQALGDKARLRLLEGMWNELDDGNYSVTYAVLDGGMNEITKQIEKW